MITYQVERWPDCVDEMSQLWHEHWQEVAMNKDKIKLSPDYETYELLDKNNILHVVTAREDEKIIGYHISLVKVHLHYKESLSAFTDVFFIHPDKRKGFTGIRLFQHVEETLKARGVEKLFGSCKLSLDLGKLYEHLGWTETERLYTKYIGS